MEGNDFSVLSYYFFQGRISKNEKEESKVVVCFYVALLRKPKDIICRVIQVTKGRQIEGQ